MNNAEICWISGSVLRARVKGTFRVGEAIEVGARGLPGEVIRLKGEEFVAQVYEDTTGLRPGDMVRGTGSALSVRLGPGLLGRIFDGLLRPLDRPAGGAEASLQKNGRIPFRPLVKPGERLADGTAFGETIGATRQLCMLPPDVAGTVERIAGEGLCDPDAILCTVRTSSNALREVGFFHHWAVRDVRPVRERLPTDEPMITGQRILDSLFPVAQGGKAAMPGGFGTGKTVLLEALAKGCNADVIVYLGCGERGNEMAGVLDEFPDLIDPRTGRPLMERTVIIANTSNMPVAAREASIYLRGHGRRVFPRPGLARRADGRLDEPLGRGAARSVGPLRRASRRRRLSGLSVGSRLADFYERAATGRDACGRASDR